MTRVSILGCVLGLLLSVSTRAAAQATPPPAQTPPAAPAEPPAAVVDYVFPSGAGLLIFHVVPAKASDFDGILVRLREALTKADSQTRRTQAENWSIYKSAEKPGDSVTYLFLFDPAVTTASYDPLLVLAEGLPAEVQPLYERLKAAVVRIERMGLTKVR